jgi:DNA-binding SARP family transcriptional activator
LSHLCDDLGKTLAPRIYVTGDVTIEHDGVIVREKDLPGRQGRHAFVYLVLKRSAPISRDDLVDVLWRDETPPELETAMSAILSKLRAVLRRAQLTDAMIDMRQGTVALRLPPHTRIDVEDATNAIDESEGAWRRQLIADAWSHANVAVAIARRPLLPREEAPWLETERGRLQHVLARGLHILSAVSAGNGEAELAVQYANEVVQLEPFRETGYQQLMRLHAAMGNRGEALRVFARLRERLRDELGTSPSPQTEAVFREITTA